MESSSQLTPKAKEHLESQAYRIVGNHSAVKTCGWTKNMIRGQGGCYKLKFYGIMSNQCMQMTTSISCANRCSFCWRGYKSPVSKDWKWAVDDPEEILEESLIQHKKLLDGFGGLESRDKKAYEKSKKVEHVALSLTGEPISYPKINEICHKFHERGISTFIVTNAQFPEQIKNLIPITQLYISLDAPSPELLKEVDVPLFKDYWERLNLSLDYLAEKKARTCIRMTIIKGMNDVDFAEYAKLIVKGDPDFLEIKAYMWVGESQERLKKDNMPLHEEIVEFTQKLMEHLPEYGIVTDHVPSRVVMVAKNKFKINGKWHTWIDYPKFHELALSGKEFESLEYCKVTPWQELSGQTTADHHRREEERRKQRKKEQEKIDEETSELEFWKKE